ncbi:cytochrome b561 domain-containing protein At2g30890 [Arachis hypogaea]|uniref:cytochrome b561 domain-containing protein At2g30890 n=1 Tax=Arachis hypogaea TaxID=3818 RepID=UPI000DEC7384|nr:cytochrome b561 domain-containing protein At4g18260 [Arachis hypogaea]
MGIEKKLFEASLVLILFTTLVSSSQEQNNKELIATHVLSTKGNRIEMNPRLVLEITVHGFLLWASMGFLMPFGILAIRHGNREQNPKRLRIIFYLHAILEMLAIVIATAGAIMSIKNFNNLFNNNHQRLGVALYAVIWLQLVLGIFRPQRGSKRRRVWFLAHWIVGTSVSLLGVLAVYTGLGAIDGIFFTIQITLIVFLYLFQEKWVYIQNQGVLLGNEVVNLRSQEPPYHQGQKDKVLKPESC